jgi:hypothetical protein
LKFRRRPGRGRKEPLESRSKAVDGDADRESDDEEIEQRREDGEGRGKYKPFATTGEHVPRWVDRVGRRPSWRPYLLKSSVFR